MLSKKFKELPIDSIIVDRADRQRREIDTTDIDESIKRRGVLVPICVTESGRLVFGERRLTAAKKAGHTKIMARIAPDILSRHDLELLELEENLMRQDLPWQDKARAMARLFKLSGATTHGEFAESIGYDRSLVAKTLSVAEELEKEGSRVVDSPTLKKAINVITRQRERESNEAIADILDSVGDSSTAMPPIVPFEAMPILNEDFTKWAPAYEGVKFNVVHCDFPYGIQLDESDQLQVGGNAHDTYDDSPEVFWKLLNCLADNKERILSYSCHMIFWHSMKRELYVPMLEFFRVRFPEFTFEDFPLIWMKSDNRGIAPDVERRPRRIYEPALFGWRGERKLVKLASNAYAAPKEASAHPSTKPEAMLRYFLSMVCDGNARLLDPTCGSGSSLRAAESLGAKVLGLELDPEFAAGAVAKHKAFRAKAAAAELVG
jgi:ParB/RepB/Spo0J family partition protein